MDKTQTLEDLTYLKRSVLAWLEYGEGRYSGKDGALLFEKDVNEISNSVRSVDEGAINDSITKEVMLNDLQEYYGYTEDDARLWVSEYGEDVVDRMWVAYSAHMERKAENRKEDE